MRPSRIRYNANDSLKAEYVVVKARNISKPKRLVEKRLGRTIERRRIKLSGTASAKIERQPAEGYVVGDQLSAEVIVSESDKPRRLKVVSGTSTHKIQQRNLRGNVFCVITLPMRSVREAKSHLAADIKFSLPVSENEN